MLSRRRLILGVAALLGCLAGTGGARTGTDLVVSEARVRALLPGQRNTVAYLVVENRGSARITLVGAESSAARVMEIHESFIEDNMYRMRRRTEVEIPARDTVRFEPGGLHLMLFDVNEIGEQVEIELVTSDGRRQTAIFQRIAAGAG